MMKNYIIVSMFLFFAVAINMNQAYSQKKRESKILNNLKKDVVYETLIKNKSALENTTVINAGAIFEFMRICKENPECIKVADFDRLENSYSNIINLYNGLIDSMIANVNRIKYASDIKSITFESFASQAEKIVSEIDAFFLDIRTVMDKKCQAMSDAPDINDFALDLVFGFIDRITEKRLDQLKKIVITELRKLKLVKFDWSGVRGILTGANPEAATKTTREIVDIPKGNDELTLGLNDRGSYTKQEVIESYNSKKTIYDDLIKSAKEANDQEIIDAIEIQLAELESAKDNLLPVTPDAQDCSETAKALLAEVESLKSMVADLQMEIESMNEDLDILKNVNADINKYLEFSLDELIALYNLLVEKGVLENKDALIMENRLLKMKVSVMEE
jgi:hypothetical protein